MSASAYLVLGASGGIGRALVTRLTGQGSRVLVAGPSEDATRALAAETGNPSATIDARSFDDVVALARHAKKELGRLDGIANLAGSLILKPAHGTSEEEFDDTIGRNLKTAFATVRAAGLVLRKDGGSVVLVSSAAGSIGLMNHEAIAAAKAGVEGLVRSAAATYAPASIRVNAVAPGLVRTPLTSRITDNEASLAASTALHALGRIGEPDDVAAAIEWLLSPDHGWVTGQVLGVDGGLGKVRSRAG